MNFDFSAFKGINSDMAEQEFKEGYFPGKLLLAMPTLGDPRFHRAVILLCAHDENGAMGLVVNHVMAGVEFSHLVKQLEMTSDIQVAIPAPTVPVLSGGPVENSRGFLLHSAEFKHKDTVAVADAYAITGTIEALRDVATGQGPEKVLFILGYAGWGAGQLEREIQDNAWLVTEPDPAIIFGTAPEQKWEMAVQKLGFSSSMLSRETGRA